MTDALAIDLLLELAAAVNRVLEPFKKKEEKNQKKKEESTTTTTNIYTHDSSATERNLSDFNSSVPNPDLQEVPETTRTASDAGLSMSTYLLESIQTHFPGYKANRRTRNAWALEFDAMFKSDKRPVDDIRQAIDFCHRQEAGKFWRSICLKASKLRKNYDSIIAQMNQSPRDLNRPNTQLTSQPSAPRFGPTQGATAPLPGSLPPRWKPLVDERSEEEREAARAAAVALKGVFGG